MYDSRLIGYWKSDKRRTMRDINSRCNFSDDTKSKLRKLFGKLELRYTRKRCYTRFEGSTEVSSYTVLGKDPESVAILAKCPVTGNDRIYYIVFGDGYYWICLGKFREYFKRIENSA